MALEDFLSSFEAALKKLEETKGVVRVVCHLDCDGLCSASILCVALNRKNVAFSLSIVKQITKEVLEELRLENFGLLIFSDLGSSSKDLILEVLGDRQIIILDHHHLKGGAADNIIEINPLLFGLDGGKEISGAGVAYLFSLLLDPQNSDMSFLAIIGAIGDMQENRGFVGINNMILATTFDTIEIREGLRMFGVQTRPIHKVLEYSTEFYIPGVTGSELGAIKFLEDLQIPIRSKDRLRKIIDLSSDELKRLVEAIIIQRSTGSQNSLDILGPVYTLSKEQEGTPTKDLREFATLLNACGRLNKPTLGIGVCLGDKEAKKEAFLLLEDYKIEILNSLNWFYEARKSNKIIEKEYFVIINAEEYIKDTLIGTLASILSKSKVWPDGKIIIAMAHTIYDSTKISCRVAGIRNKDVNLKEILSTICDGLLGQVGGHQGAAGALIPQEKDEEFISRVQDYFSKITV